MSDTDISRGDSMIERVTKTLSGELLRRGFMTQIEDGVRLKPDIEAMARAAIEAMMEPTPEMKAAGAKAIGNYDLAHDAYVEMLRTSLTGDTK